jgi:hypothetical protein
MTRNETADGHVMKKVCYIAETDIGGTVACVWRFGPEDRIAHPLSLSWHDPADLAEAEFHGASEAAIREWLARPRSPRTLSRTA